MNFNKSTSYNFPMSGIYQNLEELLYHNKKNFHSHLYYAKLICLFFLYNLSLKLTEKQDISYIIPI